MSEWTKGEVASIFNIPPETIPDDGFGTYSQSEKRRQILMSESPKAPPAWAVRAAERIVAFDVEKTARVIASESPCEALVEALEPLLAELKSCPGSFNYSPAIEDTARAALAAYRGEKGGNDATE